MDISKIEPGNKSVVNVFIECIKGSKDFYEYDEKTSTFILRKQRLKVSDFEAL